jgi:hypothetical protein
MPKPLPKAVEYFRTLSPLAHKLITAFVLLSIVILIYPFQTTIVPSWDLQVVDERGERVPLVRVTEYWQHNSLETELHQELKATDADGKVSFMPRTIRASLIKRAYAPLMKFLQHGNRAKFGPYASVLVWGGGYRTTVEIYEGQENPHTRIVVAIE